MDIDKYQQPFGYYGVGSDIQWCKRWKGGKHCLHCRHYANFNEWSKKWNWHYLLSWYDDSYRSYWNHEFAHYSYGGSPWCEYVRSAKVYKDVTPSRYKTVGLKEGHIRSLLKNGCKKNRKCKCVSVAQRGSWYCPGCYHMLERMAGHYKTHIHNLMLADRKELKKEILIMLLSGSL